MQYNQILFYHDPWLIDLKLLISSTAARTHKLCSNMLAHSDYYSDLNPYRSGRHTPTWQLYLTPVESTKAPLVSLPFQTICFCASPHQWWLPHVWPPPASYSTCPPHGPPVCSASQPIHGTTWCPAPRNSWCECLRSDHPLTLTVTLWVWGLNPLHGMVIWPCHDFVLVLQI